jgi:uncharacterized membrane protein
MNAVARFFIVAVLMVLIDLPWLRLIGDKYSSLVRKIQGGSDARMRPLPGVVVYLALAFLVLKTKSLKDAFLTGAAVYAVYDFTVMAVFKDYTLGMAVADTIWGGILFTLTRFLLDQLKI